MACDYTAAIDTISDYGGFVIESDEEVAIMRFKEGVFIVTMRGRPENCMPVHGKNVSIDAISNLPYVTGFWPVDLVEL